MVRWIAVVIILVFFLFGVYDFTDLKEAFIYYGEIILPSHSIIGAIIVFCLIIIIIFGYELKNLTQHLFRKIKKIKVKEEFK